MKIQELRLTNYRSYADETTIRFGDGINTIVGENNVGKTTLLSAISGGLQSIGLSGRQGIVAPDIGLFSKHYTEVRLKLLLNQEELAPSLTGMGLPTNDVRRLLGDQGFELLITVILTTKGFEKRVQLGNLSILGNTLRTGRIEEPFTVVVIWPNILKIFQEEQDVSILDVISSELNRVEPSGNHTLVQIPVDLETQIASTLNSRLVYFPEFRQRPAAANANVTISPEGTNVASILFDLKNGAKIQKKRFTQIKHAFEEIYRGLRLDVQKGPRIVVERLRGNDYEEIPLDAVGAGVTETIILLVHLVGSTDNVVLVDTPELHHHPHAQRVILELLRDFSTQNQVILCTHSPEFVDPLNVRNTIRLRQQDGITSAAQVPDAYFTEKETAMLERSIDRSARDLFFSRAVLLVEGETEEACIPIFAKKVKKDFDLLGISNIAVGGDHFFLHAKLLGGFKIPYAIMCDKNVGIDVTDRIIISTETYRVNSLVRELYQLNLVSGELLARLKPMESQISDDKHGSRYDDKVFPELQKIMKELNCFVLPGDFEDVLKDAGYEKLMQEASKTFSKSKSLQGRWVAEHISAVPAIFQDVIKSCADRAG